MELPDFFSPNLSKLKYFVIVTETKFLDNNAETVAGFTRRGIYGFSDKDKATSFKTSINRAADETIAHLFIKPEREIK